MEILKINNEPENNNPLIIAKIKLNNLLKSSEPNKNIVDGA